MKTPEEVRNERLEDAIRIMSYTNYLYEEKLFELLGKDKFNDFVIECIKKLADHVLSGLKKGG